MAEQIITKEYLHELFEYKDGELYWKITHRAGQLAGSSYSGYRCIKVNGKLYKAHRLIYLMHHGELPQFLDHIDGNPLNNQLSNLRPANKSQNGFNRKMNSNSTSGHKGVSWDKQSRKWKIGRAHV